jgi:hypothetical protein
MLCRRGAVTMVTFQGFDLSLVGNAGGLGYWHPALQGIPAGY